MQHFDILYVGGMFHVMGSRKNVWTKNWVKNVFILLDAMIKNNFAPAPRSSHEHKASRLSLLFQQPMSIGSGLAQLPGDLDCHIRKRVRKFIQEKQDFKRRDGLGN